MSPNDPFWKGVIWGRADEQGGASAVGGVESGVRGKISLVKAAELLELGYRQMKRVWSRHQREGDGGVVHRLRGRRSNRRRRPE